MFEDQASLNSLLICKCCNGKLEYPHILPCGKLACYHCIEMFSSHKRQQFNCPICYKMHLVPKEGFIESDEITTLVDFTAHEAERKKLVSNFKLITNLIEEKTDSIGLSLKIKDNCIKARDEVQLAIEEAHTRIEQIHRELIDQINAYEKEFYEQLKSLNKQDIEKIMSEARVFCERSKSFLNQHKIDEFQLKKNYNEASELLNNLLIVNDKLECSMMNAKVINFQRNKNFLDLFKKSSVLGEIRITDFQVVFLQNIARFSDFNFEPYINKISYSLNLMSSSNILIGYKTLSDDLNLVIMSQDGDVLCEKKNINKNKVCRFETAIANNLIYVCTKEIENHFISIHIFDISLNEVNKLDINDTEFSMTSCFDSIIMSSTQEDDFILLTKFENSKHEEKDFNKLAILNNNLQNHNSIFNYLNNLYNLFLPW